MVRFSVLTKFFISFLLTGVILVALLIIAMQVYTFQNFGEYVDNAQLEKLSGLTTALAEVYEEKGDWTFLRGNHNQWIEIFVETGLIRDDRPHQGHPPQPRHLREGFVPPPEAVPGPLDVGPRITLFDAGYRPVMGRARSPEEHAIRPIVLDDKVIGYLGIHELANLSSPLDLYYLAQQKKMITLVGGAFLIIYVLVSYVLASHLLSPVKKLSRATRDLARRKFDTRLDVATTDELGQLAQDFNTMAAQLMEYEQQQKQWLSDISHELRTPLSVLIGEIDAVRDGIRKSDPEVMRSIQAEALHLRRLVEDLHTLSKEETELLSMENRSLDLIALLEETLGRFEDEFVRKEISLVTHLESPAGINVSGDPDRLLQLFSNLMDNTLRYTDAPGQLLVSQTEDNEDVILVFEDSAPSVPRQMHSRIFDRLVRVDSSRNRKTGGSGIGLAVCRTIVEKHGGSIHADDSSAGGLQIEIRLPFARRG
jgi:two-component system sensor histidine kinase BaeS